jgi:colanic acid/amylovoran biosynthesis protein
VHVVEEVGSVLHNFARQQHAALLPVPIAFHECANDRETIRRLMAGFDDQSDGGSTLDTPRKIVEQIARCRVVVTGAYHAAVFALSQGIPVIGLSNFAKKLHVAIEEAWGSADKVRLPLLNSATQQIERGRSAYQSLKSLLERRAQRNSLFDSVRAERVV